MNSSYKNLYGTWVVTTEGDCEGRSIRNLGTHTGWLDTIALNLAKNVYYSLRFKKVEPNIDAEKLPTATEVSVSMDIDSGTWDMKNDERAKVLREVFKDRPVVIKESNFYASFIISIEPERKEEILRQQALAKLTEADRKLLGLS